MTIAISNAMPATPAAGPDTKVHYELRPRVAYPHRDLSEGLEVKASRGLAHVRRALLHRADEAPAAIDEPTRVVEEVPG
jgi:hypothetical protein